MSGKQLMSSPQEIPAHRDRSLSASDQQRSASSIVFAPSPVSSPNSPSRLSTKTSDQQRSVEGKSVLSRHDSSNFKDCEDHANNFEAIVEKFKLIQKNRDEKKLKTFENVFFSGMRQTTLGQFCSAFFLGWSTLTWIPYEIRTIFIILSIVTLATGMYGFMLVSTVDPEKVNVDKLVFDESSGRGYHTTYAALIRVFVFTVLVMNSLCWVGSFVITPPIELLFACLALIPESYTKYIGFPRFSYKFMGYMILDEFCMGCIFLYNAIEARYNLDYHLRGTYVLRNLPFVATIPRGNLPKGPETEAPFLTISIACFLEFAVFAWWTRTTLKLYLARPETSSDGNRELPANTDKNSLTHGSPPFIVCYVSFYLYMIRYGYFNVWNGYTGYTDPKREGISNLSNFYSIANGVVTILPPFVIMLIGSDVLFHWEAQKFEENNKKDDGASMAILLDDMNESAEGDSWWVKSEKLTKIHDDLVKKHKDNNTTMPTVEERRDLLEKQFEHQNANLIIDRSFDPQWPQWQKGKVVEVGNKDGKQGMWVELTTDGSQLRLQGEMADAFAIPPPNFQIARMSYVDGRHSIKRNSFGIQRRRSGGLGAMLSTFRNSIGLADFENHDEIPLPEDDENHTSGAINSSNELQKDKLESVEEGEAETFEEGVAMNPIQKQQLVEMGLGCNNSLGLGPVLGSSIDISTASDSGIGPGFGPSRRSKSDPITAFGKQKDVIVHKEDVKDKEEEEGRVWVEFKGGHRSRRVTINSMNTVSGGATDEENLGENCSTKSDKSTSTKGGREIELLNQAQKDLKCVSWDQLDKDIFDKSPRATSEEDEKIQKKNAAELHKKAKIVPSGQTIDFFVSHSWDDDGEAKYNALKEVADDFYEDHGRYPTLWLDKVCFDQENLADGLKALPVNVMMCKQLLSLVGKHYTGRLWCIWELYTLFSFADPLDAAKHVTFKTINDNSNANLIDELRKFDVANAHCFDPNEEEKIRKVIGASGDNGVRDFNGTIQSFADKLNTPTRTKMAIGQKLSTFVEGIGKLRTLSIRPMTNSMDTSIDITTTTSTEDVTNK